MIMGCVCHTISQVQPADRQMTNSSQRVDSWEGTEEDYSVEGDFNDVFPLMETYAVGMIDVRCTNSHIL